MAITLNTQVFDHIKNGVYQLAATVFGGVRRLFRLSPFAKRKGKVYTGSVSASQESDITLPNSDVERRTDSVSLNIIAHDQSDIAVLRGLVADVNAFVQSADFAAYMTGRVEF